MRLTNETQRRTPVKPIIGITTTINEDMTALEVTFQFQSVTQTYIEAVQAAGGVPILLAAQFGNTDQILDLVDGIIFSGGADIDPEEYGVTEKHPTTYGVNALRDKFEIELLQGAVERDMPVLGICRGVQVMNVALGGTLHQHVAEPDVTDGSIGHRQHEAGKKYEEIAHHAAMSDNPVARSVYPMEKVPVNSFHHQAIDRVAPVLEPVAYSDDGLVEAVAHAGKTFVFGVQWHPEMMFTRNPEQLGPFSSLVGAARAHRAAPANR